MDITKLIVEVRRENTILMRKTEELERLRSICHVTGVNMEGERVSGSHNNSRVEQAYLNYIEYKDEVDEYISKTKAKRKLLNDLIDTLESQQEIEVMYKYCLANMSVQDIANTSNWSRSNVYRIYNKARNTIQESMNKNVHIKTQINI